MSEATSVAYFTITKLDNCDLAKTDLKEYYDDPCVAGVNRVSISEVSSGGLDATTKCKEKCKEEFDVQA